MFSRFKLLKHSKATASNYIFSKCCHTFESNHFINNFVTIFFPAIFVKYEPSTKYEVAFRIQSECWKIRTRITPNTDTFHSVTIFHIIKHMYKKILYYWNSYQCLATLFKWKTEKKKLHNYFGGELPQQMIKKTLLYCLSRESVNIKSRPLKS